MITTFTPIRRRSLSDAVYEQLRDQIVTGAMAPGSDLPAERALCEALGVNRGAVREALKRLAQARLVAVSHGETSRVLDYRSSGGLDLLAELLVGSTGQIDLQVVRSIVEMRSAVAPDMARLAARRRQPGALEELSRLVEEMGAAQADLARLQDLVAEFWAQLADASGNVAYRLSYNTLRSTYDRAREALVETLAEELRDWSAYRALLEAVRAQREGKAREVARGIVAKGEARLLAALEILTPSQEPNPSR